jgi:hypothetical protein
MATAPVQSQPLHNFSLPFLKWGGKSHTNTTSRYRRTVSPASSEPDSDYHDSDPPPPRVGSRSARNRFGFSPCSISDRSQKPERGESCAEADDGGERKREATEEEEAEAQKPWNLRPRKAAQRSAMMEIRAESAAIAIAGVQQQHQSENVQPKSLRLRGAAESQSTEKRKFWIALSKEEIEEDVFVMTGSRPARRPRKRPKNIQKQLDVITLSLFLFDFSFSFVYVLRLWCGG